MYLRRQQRIVLIALAALAIVSYFAFVRLGVRAHGADYAAKVRAAETTLAAEQAIRAAIDSETLEARPVDDPLIAAMLGLPSSPITTDAGSLRAKVTSTNPNFAAVIVGKLRAAGVREGSVVVISCTASFPALNIAGIAAVEALGAVPVIVGSVGASTWGANDPEFTYLDMESLLVERGILRHHTLAASVGGDFRLRPVSEEGRRLAQAAIARNGVVLLQEKRLQDAVKQRLNIIDREAAGRPIEAFINIGGGLASVGAGTDRPVFDPGLTVGPASGDIEGEGLMFSMRERGVPVINLQDVVRLARAERLPVSPDSPPPIGEGRPYHDWLRVRVAAVIGAVTLVLATAALRLVTLIPNGGERFFDAYFGFLPARLRRALEGARGTPGVPERAQEGGD